MKKLLSYSLAGLVMVCIFLSGCHNLPSTEHSSNDSLQQKQIKYRGFSSQVAWGKHLVEMGGCSDCHTPKVMTEMGPGPDTTMYLAGHPAKVPPLDINRKEIEKKGLMVTRDMTQWIGPWGITYSANITPDKKTGIGNWTAEQFILCIRKGKENGSANARPLLPPMNFVAAELSHHASDAELKAVFAFLQTIKPVHNPVPAPVPPANKSKH